MVWIFFSVHSNSNSSNLPPTPEHLIEESPEMHEENPGNESVNYYDFLLNDGDIVNESLVDEWSAAAWIEAI